MDLLNDYESISYSSSRKIKYGIFKKNDNCRKKYYTRTKNYLLKNIHEKKIGL